MNESRPTWDDVWLTVAHTVAKRSLCDRDRVGAVVVSATQRIIDTGYNGPPRGMPLPTPDARCSEWCPRNRPQDDAPLSLSTYENCFSLHAEANALSFCDRSAREDGTIYVSSGVCGDCAKLIANSGLVRVVCDMSWARGHSHRDSQGWLRWLTECGLECIEVVNET